MSEPGIPGTAPAAGGVARVLSDDRLTRRASEGDRRAFAAIFSRYSQRLYRFCLAIVGDPQDAQDALQNTMVKVLGALPGESRQIKLKPWLYRIAHNESVELLRRRRPADPLDPELAGPQPGLAEEAAVRERLSRLISDLEELPERQRGALVMRELAGLDFAEIGAALGASSATARQTVYEARLNLHEMDAGREMSCATVKKALSNADGRVVRRRDVRAHLRTCASCRHFGEEVAGRQRDLALLAPLPAAAAMGLLHGALGGGAAGGAGVAVAGGGSGAAGLTGALGGGVGKVAGGSVLAKSVATAAVAAVVGVSVADRGGLVDVVPREGGAERAQPGSSAGAGGSGDSGSATGAATPGGLSANGARRRALGLGSAASLGGAVPGAEPGDRKGNDGSPRGRSPGATRQAPPAHSSAKVKSGGRDKAWHPAAASHGQQTASAHKGGGRTAPKGGGGSARQGPPPHAAGSRNPPQPSPPAPKQSKPKSSGSEAKSKSKSSGSGAAPPTSPAKPSQPQSLAPAPPAESGEVQP